jgi:hypothetical protein
MTIPVAHAYTRVAAKSSNPSSRFCGIVETTARPSFLSSCLYSTLESTFFFLMSLIEDYTREMCSANNQLRHSTRMRAERQSSEAFFAFHSFYFRLQHATAIAEAQKLY